MRAQIWLLTFYGALLLPLSGEKPTEPLLFGVGLALQCGLLNPPATVAEALAPSGVNPLMVEQQVPRTGLAALNFLDISAAGILQFSSQWELAGQLSFSSGKSYLLALGSEARQSFDGWGVVYDEKRIRLLLSLCWVPVAAVDPLLNFRVSPVLGLGMGALLLWKRDYGLARVRVDVHQPHPDMSPKVDYTMEADFSQSSPKILFFPAVLAGMLVELAGLRVSLQFQGSIFFQGRYHMDPIFIHLSSEADPHATSARFSLPKSFFYSEIELGVAVFLSHPAWRVLQQRLKPPLKPYADRIG